MSFSDEQQLLVREFDQWYKIAPNDGSAIRGTLDGRQFKSAFEKKIALYALSAEKAEIKVFRHFPFFFELNAGRSVGSPSDQLDDSYTKLYEKLRAGELARIPENPFAMRCLLPIAGILAGTDAAREALKAALDKAQAFRRREFCRCSLAALDAADALSRRFAEQCAHMAEYEITPEVRKNLARMAQFDLTKPCRTVFDTLQALLFWRETLQGFEGADYISWGDLDAALAESVRLEKEAGTFDHDETIKLLRSFLTYHVLRKKDARMDVTLGRVPSDATALILEALDRETMRGLRLTLCTGDDDTDEYRALLARAMRLCPRVLSRALGLVPVGNALQGSGEARLCDIVISLPGVLMGTLLPETVDRWAGMHIDCYDGDFYAAEDIYATFMDNLAALEQNIVPGIVDLLTKRTKSSPMLLHSALDASCVSRARDLTDCGAARTTVSVGFDGVGVFLRSLSGIKALCYDSRRVPMFKLIAALKNNYNGDEALYRLFSSPRPVLENMLLEKFTLNITGLFRGLAEKPETQVCPTLLTASDMGSDLMATPDGRFWGDSLQSDFLPEEKNALGGGIASLWLPYGDDACGRLLNKFNTSGCGMMELYDRNEH